MDIWLALAKFQTFHGLLLIFKNYSRTFWLFLKLTPFQRHSWIQGRHRNSESQCKTWALKSLREKRSKTITCSHCFTRWTNCRIIKSTRSVLSWLWQGFSCAMIDSTSLVKYKPGKFAVTTEQKMHAIACTCNHWRTIVKMKSNSMLLWITLHYHNIATSTEYKQKVNNNCRKKMI